MRQIELTTIMQINYHLAMGEYVIFDIGEGFGFLKQDEEENSGVFNDKGVEFIIQTNDGVYCYDAPDKKGAYVKMLNELLSKGVKFYVIPGLKIKKVAI